MKKNISSMLEEASQISIKLKQNFTKKIQESSTFIADCLKNGNKVLICGNGGSASMSSHFAAELVGRYKLERKPFNAISLTNDLSSITAISNDYGFESIYERQIEALGRKNDILIILTTSGNSQNLITGAIKAKEKGIKIISFLGNDGGKIKGMSDIEIIVPSENTPRIQEAHLIMLHIICELVENIILSKK